MPVMIFKLSAAIPIILFALSACQEQKTKECPTDVTSHTTHVNDCKPETVVKAREDIANNEMKYYNFGMVSSPKKTHDVLMSKFHIELVDMGLHYG
jgi:hypothetical protein